ncbi:MAG: pyridoxal phosphate-dependent aminotransferase [Treponema sp.]|nr:pyridoxal phosphate-dependent aminotransferase [Treponema sp.]
MNYSESVEVIPASSIRDMMVRASKIDDIISFSVGDPDFAPADCVIEAAKAALNRKETHYAPGAGLNELRDRYAVYLSEQEGVEYKRENVIVTVGGMSCLFLTLRAIINPGDEILIPAPYFTNYNQMIKMCYGVPINVEVFEKNNFVITSDAIRKYITPKTKAIILNSPCNPTGAVISQETLKEIAEIAIQNDLFIISDEVYRHLVFDSISVPSIAQLPNMKERTLIVDSCSKTFAMTGFRIGFGAGPEHFISLMTKLTEGIHSSSPTIGQYAAIEALQNALPYCKNVMVPEYKKRRDYLFERLNKMKGISCIKPNGAFYIFVNISGTGMKAREFANELLEKAHVAVVPGENFGSDLGFEYVRMAYAISLDKIAEGCDRIERFCNTLT